MIGYISRLVEQRRQRRLTELAQKAYAHVHSNTGPHMIYYSHDQLCHDMGVGPEKLDEALRSRIESGQITVTGNDYKMFSVRKLSQPSA